MWRLHRFTRTSRWQITTAQVFHSVPESLWNTGKVTDPVPLLKHSHTKGKSDASDQIKSSLGRFSLCDCPNTPGKTNRTGNYVKRKHEWIALLPLPAVSPATSWAAWETERDAMWKVDSSVRLEIAQPPVPLKLDKPYELLLSFVSAVCVCRTASDSAQGKWSVLI